RTEVRPAGSRVDETPLATARVVTKSPPLGAPIDEPGRASEPPPIIIPPAWPPMDPWLPVGRLSVKLNCLSASSFLSVLDEAKKPPAVKNASLASCTALVPMPVLPAYQTTIEPVPCPLLESRSWSAVSVKSSTFSSPGWYFTTAIVTSWCEPRGMSGFPLPNRSPPPTIGLLAKESQRQGICAASSAPGLKAINDSCIGLL